MTSWGTAGTGMQKMIDVLGGWSFNGWTGVFVCVCLNVSECINMDLYGLYIIDD